MNDLLRKAFERIGSEWPEDEQVRFASWLISLIDADEHHWDAQFAASRDKLEILADRALADYSEGRTEVLDPEKL
jgi:hypothetical protein